MLHVQIPPLGHCLKITKLEEIKLNKNDIGVLLIYMYKVSYSGNPGLSSSSSYIILEPSLISISFVVLHLWKVQTLHWLLTVRCCKRSQLFPKSGCHCRLMTYFLHSVSICILYCFCLWDINASSWVDVISHQVWAAWSNTLIIGFGFGVQIIILQRF